MAKICGRATFTKEPAQSHPVPAGPLDPKRVFEKLLAEALWPLAEGFNRRPRL